LQWKKMFKKNEKQKPNCTPEWRRRRWLWLWGWLMPSKKLKNWNSPMETKTQWKKSTTRGKFRIKIKSLSVVEWFGGSVVAWFSGSALVDCRVHTMWCSGAVQMLSEFPGRCHLNITVSLAKGCLGTLNCESVTIDPRA